MGIALFRVENIANLLAKNLGIDLSGNQTIIPDILNNKCEKATIIAARLPVTSAASIAVTVVPRLAPTL